MEQTAYSSNTFYNDVDFIAPIKVLIRRKTFFESDNGATDKGQNGDHSLKSCFKSLSTKTESDNGGSSLGNGGSSHGSGGSSSSLPKGKARKKVSFRSYAVNMQPIAEIIRVKSYKKENLRNSFMGVGIKHKGNREINDQVFCKCLIF